MDILTGMGPIPDPRAATTAMLPHILASPPDLAFVSVSYPVAQKLHWLRLNPEDEGYLYHNNMKGHGAHSAVETLREQLTLLGPSHWQVCRNEDVHYKAGPPTTTTQSTKTTNTPLASLSSAPRQFVEAYPEVFARVSVYRNGSSTPPDVSDQLAFILLLERNDTGPNSNLVDSDNDSRIDQWEWRYFDLQDLVTPGLDTRPWHHTLASALSVLASTLTQSQQETEKGPRHTERPNDDAEGGKDEDLTVTTADDFWSGYNSASSSDSHSKLDPRNATHAPPGLSTNVTSTTHNTLLTNLAAGPATQQAFSALTTSPAIRAGDGVGVDLDSLLDAAGQVNLLQQLPPHLASAALRAFNASRLNDEAPQRSDVRGALGSVGATHADVELEIEVRRRLADSFPTAPPRLFESHSTSESGTIPSPLPKGQTLENDDDDDDGRPGSVDEDEEALEEAMTGLWKLFASGRRRQRASQQARRVDSERFVAIAHRVTSKS